MLQLTSHFIWLLPSKFRIGMALVTKQVVNDCQCKGDKGDALLTIHFISGSILAAMKARWSASVIIKETKCAV